MALVHNLILNLDRNMARGPHRGGWRTSVTFHYNGPPVALHDNRAATTDMWIQHWKGIAKYHLAKNWGKPKAPVYGNGVMYHWAVLTNGERLRLWPEEDERWHCANVAGNKTSIAIAFALGGAQDATPEQWQSACDLADEKLKEYGINGRERVYGHREWKKYDEHGKEIPNSLCPGPNIMRRLKLWRGGLAVDALHQYVVLPSIGAKVRQGPGTSFPVALDGKAVFPCGHEFTVDSIVQGEAVAGSTAWAHCLDGLGFVHASLLERIK